MAFCKASLENFYICGFNSDHPNAVSAVDSNVLSSPEFWKMSGIRSDLWPNTSTPTKTSKTAGDPSVYRLPSFIYICTGSSKVRQKKCNLSSVIQCRPIKKADIDIDGVTRWIWDSSECYLGDKRQVKERQQAEQLWKLWKAERHEMVTAIWILIWFLACCNGYYKQSRYFTNFIADGVSPVVWRQNKQEIKHR